MKIKYSFEIVLSLFNRSITGFRPVALISARTFSTLDVAVILGENYISVLGSFGAFSSEF